MTIKKNTIVVADNYQAHAGTLATILEYIVIRHRYSDKEMSLRERGRERERERDRESVE